MIKLKRFRPLVVLALLFLVPVITQDPYILYIVSHMFIWGMLAVTIALNIRTAIFNFAPSGFMAIGAYTTAILVTKFDVSFWLTLPIAAIGAAVVAILIGIPVLRIKGMYFVLVTALFAQIIVLTIVSLPEYTDAWLGIANISAPTVLMIDFSQRVPYYYLVLVFMTALFFICYRVWNSYLGKIYKYIGENEALAQSVGVPITKYRVQSFAIACSFASLAGCFLAVSTSFIEPGMFSFFVTVNVWLYAIIGGIHSIFGPLFGTALAMFLQESLRPLQVVTPIVIGGIVILVIVFLPRGVISLPEEATKLANKLRRTNLPKN